MTPLRTQLLAAAASSDRRVSFALLLGSRQVPRMRKVIDKPSLEVIDTSVCLYLAKCWRLRHSWFGGLPSLGEDRSFVLVDLLWPQQSPFSPSSPDASGDDDDDHDDEENDPP